MTGPRCEDQPTIDWIHNAAKQSFGFKSVRTGLIKFAQIQCDYGNLVLDKMSASTFFRRSTVIKQS